MIELQLEVAIYIVELTGKKAKTSDYMIRKLLDPICHI
jgi:hypothetical protein